MKKILITGMFVLMMFFSSCAKNELVRDTTTSANNEKDVAGESMALPSTGETVIDGLNEFSFDIYRKISLTSENNEFISPLSMSAALAMTYAGARDASALQLREGMHYGPQQQDFHLNYGKILDSLSKSNDDFEVNIANAVWVQSSYPLLKNYKKTVEEYYKSTSRELDFVNAPEKSRETINGWVEDKTNQRINNLIPRGVINAETRMILTNAVYFNAEWAEHFNEKLTREEPFYLYGNEQKRCQMMYKRHHFAYSKTESFEILEIPYKGNEYSMMILLPGKKLDLKKLTGEINADLVRKHDKNKSREDVMVYMPKFKLERDYELKSFLLALGIEAPFSNNADFSGMTGKKDLKISSVIHKAFIDVDEYKTEAAAATAVVMKLTAVSPVQMSPIEFRADHPFMFLIRHNESGAIMFMGQVTDPS